MVPYFRLYLNSGFTNIYCGDNHEIIYHVDWLLVADSYHDATTVWIED